MTIVVIVIRSSCISSYDTLPVLLIDLFVSAMHVHVAQQCVDYVLCNIFLSSNETNRVSLSVLVLFAKNVFPTFKNCVVLPTGSFDTLLPLPRQTQQVYTKAKCIGWNKKLFVQWILNFIYFGWYLVSLLSVLQKVP